MVLWGLGDNDAQPRRRHAGTDSDLQILRGHYTYT